MPLVRCDAPGVKPAADAAELCVSGVSLTRLREGPTSGAGNAVSDSAERLERSGFGRRQLLCSVCLCIAAFEPCSCVVRPLWW